MATLTVTNWFGNIAWHPQAVVEANSVNDIVTVMKNPDRYPPPVRVVGSCHSTARCDVADGGTVVKMKMNRILEIRTDSVTCEAGAIYIDIDEELQKRQLQFYVNTEIGMLTAGAAACAGTKDASFRGQFGQVGSYVTGVKMVLPSGDLLEVTEDKDPELMRQIRSSYGLFGIVYEVTYRVRPMTPMAVYHESFKIDDFVAKLPELKARNEALMYYLFPFDNMITVEFRRDNPGATGDPNRAVWALRNYIWSKAGPRFAHDIESTIASPAIRYGVIDSFAAVFRFKLENLVRSDNTIAADQTIRYPTVADDSRYTFSLFAFPEESFPAALLAYFKFCQDYYQQQGYRSNTCNVGYRIAQDQNALLSYSYDGAVMTIDPVSTGNTGWEQFLAAYNQFCSDRGGSPLLNQTFGVTHAIAEKAFGDRLRKFEEARKKFDPGNRLLNDYFREVLTGATAATQAG
ncbi:MAG: FAD-binding oxidoreductase [Hyphomicrobiales bacterium]|nr:FAD-binding oxidoreductase [Hyphomicrobiales bacterium]